MQDRTPLKEAGAEERDHYSVLAQMCEEMLRLRQHVLSLQSDLEMRTMELEHKILEITEYIGV